VSYEVVVIGSGPAGQKAAIQAAKAGIGQLGLTAGLDVDAYVDNVFNFPDGRGVSHRGVRHREAARTVNQ
jgi:thioredoxin reductase